MITREKAGYRQPGMAMAEYVLIGTLVLLVCIAGFMGVGTNLRDWFVSMQGDMNQQVQQTQATQLAVAQAKTGQAEKEQALSTAEAWHVNPNDPNSLCNSAFCISAPGLTGTVVSTVGANGNTNVTHSAAGIYAQLASILQEQGADPKTVDLLTRMANQGHSLGDMQTDIAVKGASYAAMAGDMTGMQSGLVNFKQMSQQLNASLGSYPPNVRALLNDASRVIIGVGDSYDFSQSKDSAGTTHIGYVHNVTNIQLTHSNSNTICDNGGDVTQCHK